MYHLAWYSIATMDVEVDILIRGVLKEKERGLRGSTWNPGNMESSTWDHQGQGPGPSRWPVRYGFLGKKNEWSPSVWLWWGWIPALSKIQ